MQVVFRLTGYYDLFWVLAKDCLGIICKGWPVVGGGNSRQVTARREVEKSGLACRQRLNVGRSDCACTPQWLKPCNLILLYLCTYMYLQYCTFSTFVRQTCFSFTSRDPVFGESQGESTVSSSILPTPVECEMYEGRKTLAMFQRIIIMRRRTYATLFLK